MPRDLFQPTSVSSAPLGRRASVVPVSVAAHALAIGAAVLVPAFAVGALPDPRASLTYNAREAIVPVVPAPAPPAGQRTRRPAGAPLVTPSALPPLDAPPVVTSQDIRGSDDSGAWPDGVPEGLSGGVGSAVAELPPPPPPPQRIVHVGGDIRPPVKIRDAAPVYPVIARSARVQGIVIIEATIDETGHVSQTRLRKSIPLLDEAALTAVRQWVFMPTRLNGEPTAVVMTVTVQFRLE